jgi:hypothetical protein
MNIAIENIPNTAGRASWGCLAIAWICFLVPVPGLGLFIGWPLNLVAFILAIVSMSKRGMMSGLLQLIASLVASPIVYLIGWGIFAGAAQIAADKEPGTEQQTASTIDQITAPSETIDAKSLFAIYEANEVAGDARFKDKRIIITGTIESINSGIGDEPTVLLKAEQFQSVHLDGIDKNQAATLSKGQYISAECTGGGEIIGSPLMKDCKIN